MESRPLFFIKVRVILIFVQVLAFTKSLLVYQQISMTDQICFDHFNPSMGSRDTGQIILVKQVDIYVYSIEVRYLSIMAIIYRRMAENWFAPPTPREFRRHILSRRELKAESFKRCLHSVLRGVSL